MDRDQSPAGSPSRPAGLVRVSPVAQPPIPHPNDADAEAIGFYCFAVAVAIATLLTFLAT
jgi:hypothetical protein